MELDSSLNTLNRGGGYGCGCKQRDDPIALAYRPDDPQGGQRLVIASPIWPIRVFPLLQQILVAPEAFLLIANPAWGGQRQTDSHRRSLDV